MNREEWLDRILEEAEKGQRTGKTGRPWPVSGRKGDSEEKGFFGSLFYGAGKLFGVIDYDSLADAAMDALGEEIEMWKEKDNPFRQTLLAGWDSMVRRFLEDRATEEAMADFGRELFRSLPMESRVEEAVDAFLRDWGEGSAFQENWCPR